MEVLENYDLPFDNEFDWRLQMFSTMKEAMIEAVVQVVTKYKEEDAELDWKDDDAILSFIISNNLFDEVNEIVKNKLNKKILGGIS